MKVYFLMNSILLYVILHLQHSSMRLISLKRWVRPNETWLTTSSFNKSNVKIKVDSLKFWTTDLLDFHLGLLVLVLLNLINPENFPCLSEIGDENKNLNICYSMSIVHYCPTPKKTQLCNNLIVLPFFIKWISWTQLNFVF